MVGQPTTTSTTTTTSSPNNSNNNNSGSSSSSGSSSASSSIISSSTMPKSNSGGGGVSSHHNNNNQQTNQPPTQGQSSTTSSSSSSRCVWCRETKRQLNYVLPTQHGKKEFCSEICLLEFRRAYNKGACTPCSNCECVIRKQPPPQKLHHNGKDQEFCSPQCFQDYKQKHNVKNTTTTAAAGAVPQPPLLPPATKKKQYDPNTTSSSTKPPASSPFSSTTFSWPTYLTLTSSTPAPPHCFKQSPPPTPPPNDFATDMKLEAIDPRNTTSTCIATVIGSVGPRIRLRLDGSDNANDFWRMVDSSDEIQPIGTCEKSGGLLQPPLGFRMNASFWTTFLHKTLNGAQMAPDKCFKREPDSPRFNLFKVGHKLEAVDRKNPHLICVATVGAVDRDNIHVTFDGWRGAFDYWCKYDSRDIFPVGWCELAGHPLQPPGNKGATTTTPSSNHHHHHDNQPNSPNNNNNQQSQQLQQNHTVTLHLHPTCNCGPYLDPSKLRTIPTIIGPSSIQDVYNQFIAILRGAAVVKSGVDVDSLLYGSGKAAEEVVLLEQGDFWSEVIGINERWGFCTNFVGDKSFDLVLGGGGSRVLARDCGKCGSNNSNKSGSKPNAGVFNNNTNNTVSATVNGGGNNTTTTMTGGQVKVKRKSGGGGGNSGNPVVVKKPSTVVEQKPVINNHNNNNNQQVANSDSAATPPEKKRIKLVGSGTPQQQQQRTPVPTITNNSNNNERRNSVNNSSAAGKTTTTAQQRPPPLPTDPNEWDVELVIRAITNVDGSMEMYSELFRKHEIDGKAMLLLNSDMMMRYMGLKLGPALKICNIINKFKSSSGSGNSNNSSSTTSKQSNSSGGGSSSSFRNGGT